MLTSEGLTPTLAGKLSQNLLVREVRCCCNWVWPAVCVT